ncbi:4-hydroxybenzoyl-CoA thioesterase [Spongiactinospora gelatinilytica]|uniref:4-hydroxybenzoyl-CoA thioesterase n=1 Tax=Spongiactinospora gelatinilytica TaxID=2666298 RepID=A0A2W2GFI1_9ACTN|nr:thioesterase family protein [Spongiactinospora gelatinilytica]PZG46582.1 4-hydroxybenzoyl-CoA thioesterase [Spongiactinospora gelatinilytica]
MSAAPAPGTLPPAAVRHRVEHVDIDASGVVHFARHASLLETAALSDLDRLGAGIDVLAGLGLDLVVVDLRMRYQAPARFLDHLDLAVCVLHVGAASFRLSGTISRVPSGPGAEAQVLSTGVFVFGVAGRACGTARPLPEKLRTLLKECRRHADI